MCWYPRFVNETETNTVSFFFYIKQLHGPSFVSKRCCNFKRLQSDYLFIYLFIYLICQNHPLSQYYRDHQLWGVSKTRGRGRGLGRGLSFF